MIAGMYGFLGAIVAMVGVSVGLLVRISNKVDRIEELLAMQQKENE